MTKNLLKIKSSKTGTDEKGVRLLLVDEDANDLEYYSAVLRHLGYDVRPVGSYAKAAETLARERFDLVLVEQGSQDFEGRHVLTRAVEIDRHVPVLVLTRTVDVSCCIDALDSGAHEYVQKPLTTAEVRELVGDYIKPPAAISSVERGYTIAGDLVDGKDERADHGGWRQAS